MGDLGVVMKHVKTVYDENVLNPLDPMFPYVSFLRRKAKGVVLEIGVEKGISTAAFLMGIDDKGDAGHVYSVDIDVKCGELYRHNKWTFIHSDSQNAELVKSLVPEKIDVLFIDGWHEHPIVDNDLKNYAPLVKSGGLILMHDIRMQDVMDAYHSFLYDVGYLHFELSGVSQSPHSGGMAWGMGVMYVE